MPMRCLCERASTESITHSASNTKRTPCMHILLVAYSNNGSFLSHSSADSFTHRHDTKIDRGAAATSRLLVVEARPNDAQTRSLVVAAVAAGDHSFAVVVVRHTHIARSLARSPVNPVQSIRFESTSSRHQKQDPLACLSRKESCRSKNVTDVARTASCVVRYMAIVVVAGRDRDRVGWFGVRLCVSDTAARESSRIHPSFTRA